MKNRDFDPLDPLPADFLDALNEYISTLAAGFKVIIKPTDATVLQVVAGTGSDQVAIGIEGRWRYNSATIERASPGGSARTLDVFVTGTDNVFVPGEPGEIDNTDYSFGLSIVEHNATPVGVAIKRLVATAEWSGTAFTAVDVLVGSQSGTARHAATHAVGGSDPVTVASIGAEVAGAVAAHAALTTSAHGGIVASTDPRLTDSRTPLLHSASHRVGGSDELTHSVLSARQVLDVGVAGQIRAGRVLAAADFTTLLGIAQPIGLFSFSLFTELFNTGTAGNLVNKGTVPFGPGITGGATEAAVFAGSTAQALYISDTGSSDPFRIKAGSWGCWFRTAKRGTVQYLISKHVAGGGGFSWSLQVHSTNVIAGFITTDGTTPTQIFTTGTTDIADDRWHFAVVTYDGMKMQVYIDGVIEAAGAGTVISGLGPIFGSAGPLNIGGYGADGSTAAVQPHFGRVDEAFVTPELLSTDEIRLLYCAKFGHGLPFGVTPKWGQVSVRRLSKGGPLVSGDFPSQPVRLYDFTAGALTDAGSGNVALTNNNAAVVMPGADGAKEGSFNFVGASSQSLSSSDTGLPSGTTAHTYGLWIKTTTNTAAGIMGWGTVTTADARISIDGTGHLISNSGGDAITGPVVTDGLWHFVVVIADSGAADGVKRKLYLDGKLVGGSTVLNNATLIGAGGFRIGCNPNAAAFWTGQASRAFLHNVALTAAQLATLYAKGSRALPPSPKDTGAQVEAFDNVNVYATFDTLETQSQIDLLVAA